MLNNFCGITHREAEIMYDKVQDVRHEFKNLTIGDALRKMGVSEEAMPGIHVMVSSYNYDAPQSMDYKEATEALKKQNLKSGFFSHAEATRLSTRINVIATDLGLRKKVREATDDQKAVYADNGLQNFLKDNFGVETAHELSYPDRITAAAALAAKVRQVPTDTILKNPTPFIFYTQGRAQALAQMPRTLKIDGKDYSPDFLQDKRARGESPFQFTTRSSAFEHLGEYEWIHRLKQQEQMRKQNLEAELQAHVGRAKELGLKYDQKTVSKIFVDKYYDIPHEARMLSKAGIKRPKLSKAEKALQEFILMRFERIKDLQDATRKGMKYKPLKPVEGYIPMLRDFGVASERGMNLMSGGHGVSYMKNKLDSVRDKEFNHLIERKKDPKIPLVLDGKRLIERYYSDAYNLVHLEPVLKEMAMTTSVKIPLKAPIVDSAGITYNKDYQLIRDNPMMARYIREFVNAYRGKMQDDWLRGIDKQYNLPFVKDKKTGKPQTVNINFGQALDWFGNMVAKSYVLGNVGTFAAQPLQILNAIPFIENQRAWAKGMSQLMDDTLQDVAKGEIRKQSKYIRGPRRYIPVLGTRMSEASGFHDQAIEKLWKNPIKFADQVSGSIMHLSDDQSAQLAAYAFYYDGRMRGMGRREAGKYASKWTHITQGDATVANRTPVQNTTAGRNIFRLSNYLMGLNSMLRMQVFRNGRKPGEPMTYAQFKTAAKMMLFLGAAWEAAALLYRDFFPEVIETATGNEVDYYSPVPSMLGEAVYAYKEERSIGQAVRDVVTEPAELIPGVGGGLKYGSHPGGVVINLIGDMARALAGEHTKEDPLTMAYRGVGLPVSGTQKGIYWGTGDHHRLGELTTDVLGFD